MKVRNTKGVVMKLIDGTVVEGKMNVGESRRLSDFFNKGRSRFVVVFDACMDGSTGQTAFINVKQIIWAKPMESMTPVEMAEDGDENGEGNV